MKNLFKELIFMGSILLITGIVVVSSNAHAAGYHDPYESDWAKSQRLRFERDLQYDRERAETRQKEAEAKYLEQQAFNKNNSVVIIDKEINNNNTNNQ